MQLICGNLSFNLVFQDNILNQFYLEIRSGTIKLYIYIKYGQTVADFINESNGAFMQLSTYVNPFVHGERKRRRGSRVLVKPSSSLVQG